MVKYSLFCIDKNVSVLFEVPDALVTRVWARIYAEPERTGGRATDRPTDQLADDDEKGRHDEDSDRRPFKQISLCPRKPTPPPVAWLVFWLPSWSSGGGKREEGLTPLLLLLLLFRPSSFLLSCAEREGKVPRLFSYPSSAPATVPPPPPPPPPP